MKILIIIILNIKLKLYLFSHPYLFVIYTPQLFFWCSVFRKTKCNSTSSFNVASRNLTSRHDWLSNDTSETPPPIPRLARETTSAKGNDSKWIKFSQHSIQMDTCQNPIGAEVAETEEGEGEIYTEFMA